MFEAAKEKVNNPFRIWKTWKFPKGYGGWTLCGYSRAADKTFFHIPELKLALDAGMCRGRQPPTILLTHTHSDHSYVIGYMAKREHGVEIYCPIESTSYVDSRIMSEIELNACGPYDPKYPKQWKLIGVQKDDKRETWYKLSTNKDMIFEIFECVHAVPSVGFGFQRCKKKLKEQYRGLPGKELGKLKKAGEVIDEEYKQPMFAYLGDTSIEVFARNPHLLEYPVIIIECTFIEEENGIAERLQRDGHISWPQLKPYVLQHPKIKWVLIHFSLRWSDDEILAFFATEAKKEDLSNVVVFVGKHNEGKPDRAL